MEINFFITSEEQPKLCKGEDMLQMWLLFRGSNCSSFSSGCMGGFLITITRYPPLPPPSLSLFSTPLHVEEYYSFGLQKKKMLSAARAKSNNGAGM